MKIIKLPLTIIVLFIFSIDYCYANPSLTLLPFYPKVKIWALLIIIIIEFCVFKFKYSNANKYRLFMAISNANIISSILGIILSTFIFIGLDIVNSDHTYNDFEKLVLATPFISKDKTFFTMYFMTITWATIALTVAYVIGVYIEFEILKYHKAIEDNEKNIFRTTCYANLFTYIIIAGIIYYNVYFQVLYYFNNGTLE